MKLFKIEGKSRAKRALAPLIASVRQSGGYTLVEVLVATVILGVAVAALLGGLGTSVFGAGLHRNQADLDSTLVSAAEVIKNAPAYEPCNIQAVTNMTHAGTIVTATVNSTANLSVNQTVTIASAAGLTNTNGTWKVQAVPSSTTFTFAVSATPSGAYTGSGTASFLPYSDLSLGSGQYSPTPNPLVIPAGLGYFKLNVQYLNGLNADGTPAWITATPTTGCPGFAPPSELVTIEGVSPTHQVDQTFSIVMANRAGS